MTRAQHRMWIEIGETRLPSDWAKKTWMQQYQWLHGRTERGRSIHRRAKVTYRGSPHGIARQTAYNRLPHVVERARSRKHDLVYREQKRDYKLSPLGRETDFRYRQSLKARETRREWVEDNLDGVRMSNKLRMRRVRAVERDNVL